MTANQYRAALARLGLTQVEAARLLGVTARTSRYWAEKGVKGPAEILLEMLEASELPMAVLSTMSERSARRRRR